MIFLSYSRHDSAFANWVFRVVEQHGLAVYMDVKENVAGDFTSRIQEKIYQSTYVLVVVSINSVNSGWVQSEVAYANANTPPKTIIPLLLGSHQSLLHTPAWYILARIQSIDFSDYTNELARKSALQKLANMMGIQLKPSRELMLFPEQDVAGERLSELSTIDGGSEKLTLTAEQLDDMLLDVHKFRQENPEAALNLLNLIRHQRGAGQNKMLDTLARAIEQECKPGRLQNLFEQIQRTATQGSWGLGLSLAQNYREQGGKSSDIQGLIDKFEGNLVGEEWYKGTANLAHKTQRWDELESVMEWIWQECPEYGDPDQLLYGRPITPFTHGLVGKLATFTLPDDDTPALMKFAPIAETPTLVVASASGNLYVYNIDINTVSKEVTWKLKKNFLGTNKITAIAFDYNGQKFAVAINHEVFVHDLNKQTPTPHSFSFNDPVRAFALFSTNAVAAVKEQDSALYFYPARGAALLKFGGATEPHISHLEILDNGRCVALCEDGQLQVWDLSLENKQKLSRTQLGQYRVSGMWVARKHSLVALLQTSRTIQFVEIGNIARPLPPYQVDKPVNAISFAEETRLMVVLAENELYLFYLRNDRNAAKTLMLDYKASLLAVSPCGRLIALANPQERHEITLWGIVKTADD